MLEPTDVRAWLFDLDGVITPTAEIHEHAWSELFNTFLDEHHDGDEHEPFTARSYLDHVDGKPRLDGVRDFLASRGIELPEGGEDDEAGAHTVHGLGNAKNDAFLGVLRRDGIAGYDASVAFLDDLAGRDGVRIACVTSSRNGPEVLDAAGLRDRFEVLVDGNVRAEEGLRGKPAPDTYLLAAERLGVPAAEAAVVEDATSGVAAGRAGDFGLVVGVDRGAGEAGLREHGADVVVTDLTELR